jgi:hypothetical protein
MFLSAERQALEPLVYIIPFGFFYQTVFVVDCKTPQVDEWLAGGKSCWEKVVTVKV